MADKALKENQLNKRYYQDFAGGVNSYIGMRQIKDNESPDAINVDFYGKGGIKNRDGYDQVGTVTDSRTAVYGMARLKTASYNQFIKFVSNGSNIALYYFTGSTWTGVTGTTFTDAVNVDSCQAGDALYTGNGTNVMRQWSGAAWSDTTNGTKGFYPTYFAKRLWVVDEQNTDTLNFSGQWAASSSKLGDFVDASAGTVTFRPGSGEVIMGLYVFQDQLHVLMRDKIYKLAPATAANTFTVTLVTISIGCVSHRSIAQAGEDIFFAADDGVYSLGDVANFIYPRTTNKSSKVQAVFDALTGTLKGKLVGKFHNFKYHLFYSAGGTNNDSCAVFDIRYQGWQLWTNMAANDAVVWTDSSDETDLYFGEPATGEVHKMYSGSTDDGDAITCTWYSKSFDEGVPDVTKLYFDTTYFFSALEGTVSLKVIFNDSEVSVSKTVSQGKPQGGMGFEVFGLAGMGGTQEVEDVVNVVMNPLRFRAKGQKFAIQYYITTAGSFQLDAITQTFIPFSHFKFPSSLKIT